MTSETTPVPALAYLLPFLVSDIQILLGGSWVVISGVIRGYN